MRVCPVCEHSQPQGAECDVCGKRFLDGAATDPPVPTVEGLEATSHPPIDTEGERLVDVEPTGHAAAALVAEDPTPGIEPTRAAPVDVEVGAAPDLEPTRSGVPDDVATALPAVVACRYCRTPAAPGERICTRCGMRLPVIGAAANDGAPVARICGCGAAVRGSRCPGCGAHR